MQSLAISKGDCHILLSKDLLILCAIEPSYSGGGRKKALFNTLHRWTTRIADHSSEGRRTINRLEINIITRSKDLLFYVPLDLFNGGRKRALSIKLHR